MAGAERMGNPGPGEAGEGRGHQRCLHVIK